MTGAQDAAIAGEDEDAVWRALANPVRRRIVDILANGPRTTGDLDEACPDLSRFAVMQHLGVLVDAGLVVARRRGRYRYNHLNPIPLRRWYRRRVGSLGDAAAEELLTLADHVGERGDRPMETSDEIRTVRVEAELRFSTGRERLFRALTEETLEWFPMTYGGERTRAVVVEPGVGGRHYEDWGDGAGYLYGLVTLWDPPARYAIRGRLMAGTILDTEYRLEEEGDRVRLEMTKVATGPITEEEAVGIRTYGDIARFEEPLRRLVESA